MDGSGNINKTEDSTIRTGARFLTTTLENAQKYIGKEVMYRDVVSKLKSVRSIENGRMIVGETEEKMIINLILFKVKDEEGNWKEII